MNVYEWNALPYETQKKTSLYLQMEHDILEDEIEILRNDTILKEIKGY